MAQAKKNFAAVLIGDCDEPLPESINAKIEHGWIAAFMQVIFSLGFGLMLFIDDLTQLIPIITEASIVSLLGVGVYFKSRFCAVALLVTFIAHILLTGFTVTVRPSIFTFLVPPLIFYAYVTAIFGTFQYHRWKRKR